MACKPAPVAVAWRDQALQVPGTYDAGIIGDQAHSKRCSGHNCGPRCTDRGDFPDGWAHASDIGVPDDVAADALLDAALHGPGQRFVLYAISRGVGYYPDWRGGGTFKASGHERHVHVSFNDRSTFHTPDFKIGYSSSSGWSALADWLRHLFGFLASIPQERCDMVICKRKGKDGGYWMLALTDTGPVRFGIPPERETTVLNGYRSAGGKVGEIDSQGLAMFRKVDAPTG